MTDDETTNPSHAAEPETQDQHTLAERLRRSRELRGLSQQAVATHTGIPRSAISDIERGVRRVDSLELKKLAVVYGQSLDYLVGADQDEDASLRLLTRAHAGISDHDREALVRFASYLEYNHRVGKHDDDRESR